MKMMTTMTSELTMLRSIISGNPRLWLVMLLVALNSALTDSAFGIPSHDFQNPNFETPEFEAAASSITALEGHTVYLPCRVSHLGDKVVSWIRTRDLHILTSGVVTYTSDVRFQVHHSRESNTWTLIIMGAKPRDEGQYECQINTDPKMKFAVTLTIRDPDMRDSPYESPGLSSLDHGSHDDSSLAIASIMGTAEQYVQTGSTITFTCVVTSPYSHSRTPKSVDWFHKGRIITVQAPRGGISLVTEKTEIHTTSRLTVAAVTELDGGEYSCRPAGTKPATIVLVVVEGERTAMQRDEEHTVASTVCLHQAMNHWATFLFLLLHRRWCTQVT